VQDELEKERKLLQQQQQENREAIRRAWGESDTVYYCNILCVPNCEKWKKIRSLRVESEIQKEYSEKTAANKICANPREISIIGIKIECVIHSRFGRIVREKRGE
jgi:hypothetical protein